jgi:hypothetical protein
VSAPTLTWLCQSCQEPVADGAGYLHVNHTEVHHVQREHADFDKRHPGVVNMGELLALPDLAEWMVHHATCDPRPESNDYWIGIERIRTHAAVINWTSHLMGKNWLTYTNWINLLRSLVDETAL